jgi:hypothetical protein
MKFSINARFRKWVRIVHRDLGYAMVGICLVYGISGILLNHLNGKDLAYSRETKTMALAVNLTPAQVESLWKEREDLPELKKVLSSGSGAYSLMLKGGAGAYDPQTGQVDYEISKKRLLIYWLNQLHYNRVKGWSVMGDIFAGSLLFLAISGLIIVPGKNGIAGRGKWYLLAGLLIPVIYILLA